MRDAPRTQRRPAGGRRATNALSQNQTTLTLPKEQSVKWLRLVHATQHRLLDTSLSCTFVRQAILIWLCVGEGVVKPLETCWKDIPIPTIRCSSGKWNNSNFAEIYNTWLLLGLIIFIYLFILKLQQVIETWNDLIARAGEWRKETTMNTEGDGDEIVM